MTETEIIKEVERYLDDEIYNYAVLIDGEWGSGKTYFVKNSLKKAIEEHELNGFKRKVKYISLYGCKDVADLQESLIWEFIDEGQKVLSEKKRKSLSKRKEKDKQNNSTIVNSARKICSGVLKKLMPEMSLYDVAWDWVRLKSCVFVFDDLERCDSTLNEVFGFINDLVEHEAAKVIIIANEKEISYSVSPNNIEQQYMVSINDGIAWPDYERKKGMYPYIKPRASNKIALDELEFRRSKLFPSQEKNDEYKKIREKLIGVTLKYDSDISKITQIIISNANYVEEVKQIIIRKLAYMDERMDFYRHHNLRTVQFFLSKVSYLLSELRKIDIEDDYKTKIEDYVVTKCFDEAVKYKGNHQDSYDNLAYFSSSEEQSSKTIREFVEKGQYVFKDYEKEIVEVVERAYKSRVDSNDPYSILNNGYYLLTQSECEQRYNEMVSRLEKNRYPSSVYENILILAARLESIGIAKENSTRIVEAMIHNLEELHEDNELGEDLYFIEEQKIREIVTKKVQLINGELRLHAQNLKRKTVQNILESDDWVEGLNQLIYPNGEKYSNDTAAFSQADSAIWIKAITGSSSKNIHGFRSWMWSLYPRNYVRKSFLEDWPIMLEIHNGIDPEKEEDLIKRRALEYVIWQIKETYKINTGEEYQPAQAIEATL